MLHEVEQFDVDNEAVSPCIESMTGHAHVQCRLIHLALLTLIGGFISVKAFFACSAVKSDGTRHEQPRVKERDARLR